MKEVKFEFCLWEVNRHGCCESKRTNLLFVLIVLGSFSEIQVKFFSIGAVFEFSFKIVHMENGHWSNHWVYCYCWGR